MAQRPLCRQTFPAKHECLTLLPLFIFTLVGMATTASYLHGQQDPCVNRAIAVNVLGEDGRTVSGISAENFQGRLHGKPVRIVSAALDPAPHRVVMVLDISGSMSEEWGFNISVAKRFLAANPASPFALITFSAEVKNRIDFSQGRTSVSNELARLASLNENKVRGQTAIRDALAAALELLRPAQFGDTLFLISDAEDNASRVKESQLRNEVSDSGVRLFSFLPSERYGILGSGVVIQGEQHELLRDLAWDTGGEYRPFVAGIDSTTPFARGGTGGALTAKGQSVMQFATSGFAQEITEAYRLCIILPEALKKPSDWKLSVGDTRTGQPNHRWQVVYPHKLARCR